MPSSKELTGLVTTMNNEGDKKGQVLGIFWKEMLAEFGGRLEVRSER